MNKIDFKTSGYFPGHIMLLGILLVIIGLPVLFIKPLIGLILWFISLVIFTTHYRLSIDQDSKVYHDYLWILGFRSGEKGRFNTLEYIFIKKSSISQTMRMRVASSTIQKEVFDGYLKFSDQHKIHLLTLDSKENLINRLKFMASSLKTRLIDYSEDTPRDLL
jgi:hypothetical protein